MIILLFLHPETPDTPNALLGSPWPAPSAFGSGAARDAIGPGHGADVPAEGGGPDRGPGISFTGGLLTRK